MPNMQPFVSPPRTRLALLAVPMLLVLLLAACGGAKNTASSPVADAQTVNVTLSDFAITPSQTAFMTGRKYHFVVTNKGPSAHEFMALKPMDMAMGGAMSMDDMHKSALFYIDESQLPSGATKTIDYTFTTATALEFNC